MFAESDLLRNNGTLDEVLLDVAAVIELSPADRKVAESRYRRLKMHLERPESPLAKYLVNGESAIYSQGSIASGTIIVSGTNDDRFDVDAIVEIDVPKEWTDSKALDLLEEALQKFPGAIGIVRRTRCIQVLFPLMHIDVTILDRSQRHPVARAGEIFHCPDSGTSLRVPSNPWGFTDWFRSRVGFNRESFAKAIQRHRESVTVTRLQYLDTDERISVANAAQHALPPIIPSELDAQQVIALKLLKRYINIRYENLTIPRPPSIYLTKRAADVGYFEQGLSIQLYLLATSTAEILRKHILDKTRPTEKNPSYPEDLINDRWPRSGVDANKDMEALAGALEYLAKRLSDIFSSPLADISKAIDELFGEQVGRAQREALAKRYDRRNGGGPLLVETGTGRIYTPAVVANANNLREVPRHNFHSSILSEDDES